jgi:hypothetical protein
MWFVLRIACFLYVSDLFSSPKASSDGMVEFAGPS